MCVFVYMAFSPPPALFGRLTDVFEYLLSNPYKQYTSTNRKPTDGNLSMKFFNYRITDGQKKKKKSKKINTKLTR